MSNIARFHEHDVMTKRNQMLVILGNWLVSNRVFAIICCTQRYFIILPNILFITSSIPRICCIVRCCTILEDRERVVVSMPVTTAGMRVAISLDCFLSNKRLFQPMLIVLVVDKPIPIISGCCSLFYGKTLSSIIVHGLDTNRYNIIQGLITISKPTSSVSITYDVENFTDCSATMRFGIARIVIMGLDGICYRLLIHNSIVFSYISRLDYHITYSGCHVLWRTFHLVLRHYENI